MIPLSTSLPNRIFPTCTRASCEKFGNRPTARGRTRTAEKCSRCLLRARFTAVPFNRGWKGVGEGGGWMNESTACVSHTPAHPLLGRPEIRGGGYAGALSLRVDISDTHSRSVYPPPPPLLVPRSVQSNFMICIHLASRAPDLPR